MSGLLFGGSRRYSANGSDPAEFADVGFNVNDNRRLLCLFCVGLYFAVTAIFVVDYNIIGCFEATC